MQIVYTIEEAPESYSKSIFLAGPTPRNKAVPSWRPEALEFLRAAGYDGVVYVPEERPGTKFDYIYPYVPAWENKMLNRADVILFWIPQDIDTLEDGSLKMPAFTTNVEFGYWIRLGKVVLGAPPNASHLAYLRFMAEKENIPQSFYLEETVKKTLELIGPGALRYGGERDIPLQVWNTPSFQSWISNQKHVGNRLDGAKLQWVFKVGKNRDKVFYWAIHANVYIASENRNKINEIVISRLDISSVVMYQRGRDFFDTKVVLIKEFRSPVNNKNGFVWELPGGSAGDDSKALDVAVAEVSEEVGLNLDPKRIVSLGLRQLMATMSAHRANLFSCELTDHEMSWIESQRGIVHGADLDNPTGEQAYTEVFTLRDVLRDRSVDFSNVGMIYTALVNSPGPLIL